MCRNGVAGSSGWAMVCRRIAGHAVDEPQAPPAPLVREPRPPSTTLTTYPLARAEFATIRDRLIKIGARVIEHIARIRIQLPTSCPERALFRAVALGLMPAGP